MTDSQVGRIDRVAVLLAAAALLLPLLLYAFVKHIPARGTLELVDLSSRFAASPLQFRKEVIGDRREFRARIANVQVVDFDNDGRMDILACDAVRHTIWLYQRTENGEWKEASIGGENMLAAPAHAAVFDFDADGDNDLAVALLSNVLPTDERLGRVVLLENLGNLRFSHHVLLDDVRRVADVQPGDFDADGDIDFAVAEFGYEHGRVLWLENRGEFSFLDHELLIRPGAVHVPVDDFDGDGDPDIAAITAQNEEAVWLFENRGVGTFEPRRVWHTENFDLGTAGMMKNDLDSDGDQDLIVSAGDNLELIYPCPQPYHGCLWLENLGDLQFAAHRLCDFAGAYAADVADIDGDGDKDVVVASLFNDTRRAGAASLIWLENDGEQQFMPWQISDRPTHLCTVACGDLNMDGLPDIVAGSLQIYEPYDGAGRITAWVHQGTAAQ